MIDWHSHILSGIDDGSHNLAESESLLEMLVSQGVDTVIATPHFYADNESVDSFLERRNKSFENLKNHLKLYAPNVLLGAEVRYYNGISKLSQLTDLSIENNRLLLLEMPFGRWTEYTVREMVELACNRKITVMLAHIDRYLKLQSSDVWQRLYESGILMQVNASFFADFLTRKKALSLLKSGTNIFIGSDCHNTAARAPRIGKAYEVISKKFGNSFIEQINEYGHSILINNNINI